MHVERPASPFDLFIMGIVVFSFTSLLFLSFNAFSSYYVLGATGFIFGILSWRLRFKIQWNIKEFPFVLFFILLGSLIFRFQPYLYIIGGQDQGVYVNMGATYEKKGSTFIVDNVRKKAIKAGLGKYYDSANQMNMDEVKSGAYEGTYLPGIYIKDSRKSEYVYQFYPLHPLWMAVTGKLLGEDNCVYSLVFFSFLSITGLYFLGLEFPGGTRFSSAVVGILIALNPLHAFFSKFPVSEIVALGYSSLGFLYLFRYYNKTSGAVSKTLYLYLSAGLFGCMFFTRITGFMYMPVFYFLFLVTLIWEKRAIVRKQLSFFFLTVFGLYVLSVAYGLIYSYPYCHDIYQASFSRISHASWETGIYYTVGAAACLLLIVWAFRKSIAEIFEKNQVLKKARENINVIFCLALTAILFLSFYKTYQFGFTDHYSKIRWGFGGLGWSSMKYSNIVVAIEYLSPMAFAVFLWGVLAVFPGKRDISWISLMFFLCMFWYLATVIRFFTPYQYYYARYLLTEVIPYTLLAVSLALGIFFQKGRLGKTIALSLAITIAGYFLYFTAFQFMGESADGAYAGIKKIDELVDEDDVIFLYRVDSQLPWDLRTPLSFFFDMNTCVLTKIADMESIKGKFFLMKFKNAFILSRDLLTFPFLEFVDEINLKIGDFVESTGIPRKYKYSHKILFLYKLSKEDLTSKVIYPLEKVDDLVNFYNGVWTNGNGIIRNIDYRLEPKDRFVRIETNGNVPGMHESTWPKPELYLNGIQQAYYSKSKNSFVFQIMGGIAVIRDLRIVSETFVPKEKGIGNDIRVLGMDVSYVVIDDKCLTNVINPMSFKGDLAHFYDGVWTDGNGMIRNIQYELKPSDRFVCIHTNGWNPLIYDNKWSEPELYINGIQQAYYSKSKKTFVFKIVGDIRVVHQIRIVSDTFIPNENGMGNDNRRLGLDVSSIEIIGELPSAIP